MEYNSERKTSKIKFVHLCVHVCVCVCLSVCTLDRERWCVRESERVCYKTRFKWYVKERHIEFRQREKENFKF
jgi:hypothetical protein